MKKAACNVVGWSSLFLLANPTYGAATKLDDVVVTASRIEETVFEAPQAVSTVKREDIIKRNYRTTPEALVYEPGVQVQFWCRRRHMDRVHPSSAVSLANMC